MSAPPERPPKCPRLPSAPKGQRFPSAPRTEISPRKSQARVPGSAKAHGVPGSAKAHGVLGSAKAHGVPGSAKAHGVPGSAKAHGVPGSAKAHGVPGSAMAARAPCSTVSPGIGIPWGLQSAKSYIVYNSSPLICKGNIKIWNITWEGDLYYYCKENNNSLTFFGDVLLNTFKAIFTRIHSFFTKQFYERNLIRQFIKINIRDISLYATYKDLM